MGCVGVSRCRHSVHHIWVPPGGQQGVWQGLQRPGGHLPQAGARLRPRPLSASIPHVSPSIVLASPQTFFTSCSEARLVLSFDPVLSLPCPWCEPCHQAFVTLNLLVICIEARPVHIVTHVPNVPEFLHTKQDSLLLKHRVRPWHTLLYYQPPGIAVCRFAEHFGQSIIQVTFPAFGESLNVSTNNAWDITMTGKPIVILQSWAHACL